MAEHGTCPYCRKPFRLFLDPRPGPAPRPNYRCDCAGYLKAIRDTYPKP